MAFRLPDQESSKISGNGIARSMARQHFFVQLAGPHADRENLNLAHRLRGSEVDGLRRQLELPDNLIDLGDEQILQRRACLRMLINPAFGTTRPKAAALG